MEPFFLFNLSAACVFFLQTLLALYFFKCDCLLAFKLGLRKTSLSFKLISFALYTLFLKFCSTFFFNRLSGEDSTFISFSFEAKTFRLFFLLPFSLIDFKLFFTKTKLFFVTLGLESAGLLQLPRHSF